MVPLEASSLQVLVVDDDPTTLRLVTKIISGAGYQVAEARDGQEALERIAAHCPDMLVTDWDMPRLDGLQLCRKLCQQDQPSHLYVLLLTGKSGCQDMVEGLEAGADDFVTKPVNPTVLLARIRAGARIVAMQRRLRELAESDPLTGVMNRRAFHERFAAEWGKATRYQISLSCAMLDLDFFKKINDTYGHAAGDIVLRETARVLKTHCRTCDVVARFGGEEFCVLLPLTDEVESVIWGERVRRAIAEMRIPYADQVLSVTGSIGLAARLTDTVTPEALVGLADQALSVAKETGRNRVISFSTLVERGPDSPDNLYAERPLDRVCARDVMAPVLYCPHEGESVGRVADMFLQLRLNAAPVVNDHARLVGMISESELLRVTVTDPRPALPIGQCMKTNVVQYDEETPAKEIYRFLARASVPRVVVVHDGRPTGVVSRATLLRWLRNWATARRPGSAHADTAAGRGRAAGILRATDAGNRCLATLRAQVRIPDADIVSAAVAEATRLEDLAHEILAHCSGHDRL